MADSERMDEAKRVAVSAAETRTDPFENAEALSVEPLDTEDEQFLVTVKDGATERELGMKVTFDDTGGATAAVMARPS